MAIFNSLNKNGKLPSGRMADLRNKFYAKGEGSQEKKNVARIVFYASIFILIAGLLGTSGYFYYQYKLLKGGNNQKEITDYTKQLEKIMILPQGETPTLATVTNKEKLGGQPFFANAQNGDKVLIFSKAMKAVLFRPKEGKIVEMMILNTSALDQLPQDQVSK
jgi:hypothetical protein